MTGCCHAFPSFLENVTAKASVVVVVVVIVVIVVVDYYYI